MRIIFVRHGHPNYEKDCLTELGHLQAAAVAQRLKSERILKIFSSTRNRAYETAKHIAAPLGMEVETCDFMREIKWGSVNGEPIFQNGHPWFTADDMVAQGLNVMDRDWAEKEPFCNNKVVAHVQNVREHFDA